MWRTTVAALLMAPCAHAEDLRIGADMDFPPYIMTEADGRLTGFDKDLMDLICDAGGFDCQWVPLPFNDTFAAVARGDVDIAIGGIGVTAARREIIAYTCIYDIEDGGNGTFFGLTTRGSPQTARISVNAATVHATALEEAGLTAVPYPSNEAALQAMLDGETDLYFGTVSYVERALGEASGKLFRHGVLDVETAGAAIVVAQTNPELQARLNTLLARLSADGSIGRLQDQWFGYNQGDVIADCVGPAVSF